MKHFLTSCFLLLAITCIAQTFPKKYVDSLTSVALSRKTSHPLILNRDSVLQLLWKATLPADRIAMFYDITNYSDELTPEHSLYFHQLILNGAQKRGDKILEAAVQAELGFIISYNGNTVEGLKMIYQSLEKAEATGNAQAIGIAYDNLGQCYPNNKQLSREYYSKALEYSRKGEDHLFVCFELSNLARMFFEENKRDSALTYYLESYRLAVEKNLEPSMPNNLLRLGELANNTNSLYYYRQAAMMPAVIRNAGLKNRIVSAIAEYYLKKEMRDSAYYFANQYYTYARTADKKTQLSALSLLTSYYEALHMPDSTLLYMTSYYNLKDSLYGNKAMEQAQGLAYADMQRLKELEAQKAIYQSRLIIYSISAVAILLLGLAFIFWRSKKKEQEAKKIVQLQKDQLEQTVDKLKATQNQLVQSEKMASLGELTAGIAHEIQNPLNFVNNFSEINKELLAELNEEIDKGNYEEVKAIAKDVTENEEKISHHGKRADAIVKGMLQHSRSSNGVKEPTDINALADEYLRLAYHGLRAKDKSFNATMITDYDDSVGMINVIPQDIGRVILNLITNAFYVVDEKKKQISGDYVPTVTVSTQLVSSDNPSIRQSANSIIISVKDNGNGIPQKVLDKIFQPFFTTKPTGQGTGLGLSLSYDIVKAHGGELKVETKEGEGSIFIIQMPA
ncbi:MAG: ATP-binding protein [Bacteroidota bacterium]